MRVTALLYHDVVPPRSFNSSGFTAPGANRYKLLRTDFAEHLTALNDIPRLSTSVVYDLPVAMPGTVPFLLTFDGGGRSGFTEIAPRLERLEWRGHFFVPTQFIGEKKFLNAEQIRELADRGHVVGSHTHTGHANMATLSDDELADEWQRSADALAEILERPVEAASVPGGSFSRRVVERAAAAGIKWLFLPGPASRLQVVDGCTTIGRYRVTRRDSAQRVAGLVEGDALQRIGQWLRWNGKAMAKRLGGPLYTKARSWYLER